MSNLNQPLLDVEPLIQFFKSSYQQVSVLLENQVIQDYSFFNLKQFAQITLNFVTQIESYRSEIQELQNNLIQQVQFEFHQYGIPYTQNQYKLLVHDDQIVQIKNQVSGLFYLNNIAPNQQVINKVIEIIIQNLDHVLYLYKISNNDNNKILQQLNWKQAKYQSDISQILNNLSNCLEPIMQQNEEIGEILEQVKQINQYIFNKLDVFEYENQDINLIQQQQQLLDYVNQIEKVQQQNSLIQLQTRQFQE